MKPDESLEWVPYGIPTQLNMPYLWAYRVNGEYYIDFVWPCLDPHDENTVGVIKYQDHLNGEPCAYYLDDYGAYMIAGPINFGMEPDAEIPQFDAAIYAEETRRRRVASARLDAILAEIKRGRDSE